MRKIGISPCVTKINDIKKVNVNRKADNNCMSRTDKLLIEKITEIITITSGGS